MPTIAEIEAAFWAKVWRCKHRWPCRKCCWPWRVADLSVNWKCVWEYHGTFSMPGFRVPSAYAASRYAYESAHGTLGFCTKHFPTCHRCQFGPCCNPVHLTIGSASDNRRDYHAGMSRPRIIYLPDGRVWDYAEACRRQGAFYEALHFQRVWAGMIPRRWRYLEERLVRPYYPCWPGR
jgi:hypothetical protein